MTETELKLRFSQSDEGALMERLRLLGMHDGKSEQLLAVYFDTPDLRLRRDGVAVRVRKEGDAWVQTVKGKGALEGGIHHREEANTPVEGADMDPTKLPVMGPLAPVFDDQEVRDRLAPVVKTDVHRRVWTFDSPAGASIEVAVDTGSVRAAGRSRPLNELELELLRGEPGELFALANQLSDTVPLELERRSKVEQGYGLVDPVGVEPVFAALPQLHSSMSAEDALVAILTCCLDHFHGNRDAVLAEQVEGVHQMRVGIRRLRSCLNVYRQLIPKEVSQAVNDETRWLNEALGPVRDLDVFIDSLGEVCAAFPDRVGLARTRGLCQDERARRQEVLRYRLTSHRYHRMVLSMAGWIQNREWNRRLDRDRQTSLRQPVSQHARRVLARLYKRMIRDGEHFEALSIEQKHAMRIRVKRLRYGLQFFDGLYPKSASRPIARALGQLQDDLGVLNDMYVAKTLLDSLGVKSGSARALLDGWYGARAASQEGHAAIAWKHFVSARRPWKRS